MTTPSRAPSPESKAAFIAQVAAAYQRLLDLVTPVTEAELLAVREPDGWTIVDVLAHIADWEGYVVQRIEARRRGEAAPVWGVDDEQVDAKNAELLAVNRALSPGEARRKASETHASLMVTLESLSEADLFDDSRREAVIGPWRSPVWLHIAANSNQHYEEHAEAIEIWLAN